MLGGGYVSCIYFIGCRREVFGEFLKVYYKKESFEYFRGDSNVSIFC